MRGQRRGIRRETLLAGVMAAGIATAAVACSGTGSTASRAAVTVSPAGTVRSSPHATMTASPASGTLVIGKAYPYRLFIHCGVRKVAFGGRTWSPVQPVPQYRGNRPVNGTVTADGYVTGAMTLEAPGTLRFTADNAIAVVPFAVIFKPAATPGLGPVCA